MVDQTAQNASTIGEETSDVAAAVEEQTMVIRDINDAMDDMAK